MNLGMVFTGSKNMALPSIFSCEIYKLLSVFLQIHSKAWFTQNNIVIMTKRIDQFYPNVYMFMLLCSYCIAMMCCSH